MSHAESNPDTPPVAILGAGITGLAAAWHLRRAGIPVTVYEAGPRAGGVIVSRREGPWLAEGGPNTILETAPRITAFIDALGLAGRRVQADPAAAARFIVRNGRPVRLPASAAGFLVGPAFSLRAKLRLLGEPFIGRGTGEESVAAFVQRRLGREFLDYAIDPMVTGIYAGDPARLSIRHAFPRIHALEERHGSLIRGQVFGAGERRRRGEVSRATAPKFSFVDGLQELTDAAWDAVRDDVHLDARVEAVEPVGSDWRVTVRRGERAETHVHPAVLLTGNAYTLARLRLGGGLPSLDSLAEIPHPPVTSVVLGFRRADVAHPCRGFGLLVPHRERCGILGTIFSSALFPGRAPAGHVTLTTYVGGARNPEAAAQADGPLVDAVVRDLDRLFRVSGRPVFTAIQRWPHAIPQYEVGHGRHLALLDDLEARAPGLLVAGQYRSGVALGDCIQAGIRAAERLRDHLSTTTSSRSVPAPHATSAAS